MTVDMCLGIPETVLVATHATLPDIPAPRLPLPVPSRRAFGAFLASGRVCRVKYVIRVRVSFVWVIGTV